MPQSTPLEESMESLVPMELSRETASAFSPPTRAPQSEELFLDDMEPALTVQPGASPQAASPVSVPAAAPVPVRAVQAPAPEPATKPAPITAATARIAPAAPPVASPVAVVSAASHFQPKTFGDLLELSLALRPLK